MATSPIRNRLNKALLDSNVADADGKITMPLTMHDLEETIRRAQAAGGSVSLAKKADLLTVDGLDILQGGVPVINLMALQPGVTGLTLTIVTNTTDNLTLVASGTDMTLSLANTTASKNTVGTICNKFNQTTGIGSVDPVLHAAIAAVGISATSISDTMAKTALTGGKPFDLLTIKPE